MNYDVPHPLQLVSTFSISIFVGCLILFTACLELEPLETRIERDTPTELPPITTEGLRTMGAYIQTDTGRLLFVASGVNRPEVALAESVSCNSFNNIHKLSTDKIAVTGIYCRRSEIGDDRRMTLSFNYLPTDSVQLYFSYSPDKYSRGSNYWTRGTEKDNIKFTILRHDREMRILSGTFSGYLINRDVPFDTIRVTDGRFDIIHGEVP